MKVGELKEILKWSPDECLVLIGADKEGLAEIDNWMTSIYPSNDDSINFVSALVLYKCPKNGGIVSKISESARK